MAANGCVRIISRAEVLGRAPAGIEGRGREWSAWRCLGNACLHLSGRVLAGSAAYWRMTDGGDRSSDAGEQGAFLTPPR